MNRLNNIIGTIAISELKGIGPAFLKKHIVSETFSSNNYIQSISEITSLNKKDFDQDTIFNEVERAKEIIGKCKEENIKIIDFNSEDYPTQLKELKDPPAILYCKGNLELLYKRTIGIIGTREPNERGATITERIGSYFSKSDWVICNGLAEGIDSFAIKSTDSYHRNVLGVLAGGLNFNSQKTLLKKTAVNAELTIQNGGLVVSEYPPDKKEDTFSVVNSCRIQAGLSDGLILIQSSLSGGSKFALKTFCQTQRPIGVVKPIQADYDHPTYDGNKEIIERKKAGLAKFTELKEDKILTDTIFVIKSKEDYEQFGQTVLNNKRKKEIVNPTLFG